MPAAARPAERLTITQAYFDANGNPAVIANVLPEGGGTVRWSICPPGSIRCAPVASSDGALQPGPEPAGTVFQGRQTINGSTQTVRSAPWGGRVTNAAPPTISGPPSVGATVAAVAGHWAGGWPSDRDQLGLEACRTATAHGCVTLSGEGSCGAPGVPTGPVRIPGWDAGAYLFAVDDRIPVPDWVAGVGCAEFPAVAPPVTLVRLPALGQTVARSAPVGPITGPPPPTIVISPRARRVGSRDQLARIACSTPCRLTYGVVDPWTSPLRFAPRLPERVVHRVLHGVLILGVPRRALGRRPSVEVAISAAGGPSIHRLVSLRA